MNGDLGTEPTLFERMSVITDPVRARMLLVLAGHELAVAELAAVFQLPQSSTSRHLKQLVGTGWVSAWAEGRSTRHRLFVDRLDGDAARLWRVVRERTAALPAAREDARRVSSVIADRRARSREFFSSAAGEWDRMRAELFGDRADLLGLLALLDGRWVVGDLGCGTGQVAESLAPFVARVIGVDDSPEMLAAARVRLGSVDNVELRHGSIECLPLQDGALDAAVAFLVMHNVVDPPTALADVARTLRPGGRILIVDLVPHDRAEYRQKMGHLWQGFAPEQISSWMEGAGFVDVRYIELPSEPDARGPSLFAGSGRKAGADDRRECIFFNGA